MPGIELSFSLVETVDGISTLLSVSERSLVLERRSTEPFIYRIPFRLERVPGEDDAPTEKQRMQLLRLADMLEIAAFSAAEETRTVEGGTVFSESLGFGVLVASDTGRSLIAGLEARRGENAVVFSVSAEDEFHMRRQFGRMELAPGEAARLSRVLRSVVVACA